MPFSIFKNALQGFQQEKQDIKKSLTKVLTSPVVNTVNKEFSKVGNYLEGRVAKSPTVRILNTTKNSVPRIFNTFEQRKQADRAELVSKLPTIEQSPFIQTLGRTQQVGDRAKTLFTQTTPKVGESLQSLFGKSFLATPTRTATDRFVRGTQQIGERLQQGIEGPLGKPAQLFSKAVITSESPFSVVSELQTKELNAQLGKGPNLTEDEKQKLKTARGDIAMNLFPVAGIKNISKGKSLKKIPLTEFSKKSKKTGRPIQDVTNQIKDAKLVQQQFPSYTKQQQDDVINLLKDSNAPKTLIENLQKLKDATPSAVDQTLKIKKASVDFLRKTQPQKQIQRGVAKTIQNAEDTTEAVEEAVKGFNYTQLSNKSVVNKAQKFIESDFNAALKQVRDGEFTAENSVIAQQLIKNLQDKGNFEMAISVAEELATKATTAGQATQALSLYGSFTPQGIVSYAQRQISKVNRALGTEKKLSKDVAKQLTDLAEGIQKLPEGRKKTVETAKVLSLIAREMPVSALSKVSFTQTLAQLLNVKTALRNIIGNVGFAAIENVKDITAVPIDILTSTLLRTGKRTKVLPNPITQLKGAGTGFKEGFVDALLGIDTAPQVRTQFELPNISPFKSKIGRGISTLLNLELRTFDRALYQAARNESLRQQLKAIQKGKKGVKDIKNLAPDVRAEIENIAHLDGLKRTFQDDNAVTKVFTGIKKALNADKGFGLGDLVLKYPKTPANLLKRGIEYSPAGFAEAAIELSKPLFRRKFNQREFVESTSRALTGTASLFGTGAILNELGIITGQTSSDRDVRSLLKETGLGGFKINASGLKRFVASGFDPEMAKLQKGDKLLSYDWIQPHAIVISMGANVNQNRGKKGQGITLLDAVLDSIDEGTKTLAEQSLVSNLTRLVSFGDLPKGIMNAIKQGPASFVPSILNQIKQFTDNIGREAGDVSFVKEALIKQPAKRIPGLSKLLPEQRDIFGEARDIFQDDSNTFFNVFFNPAITTHFNPNDSALLVLDLARETGETKHLPRVVSDKQTIKNEEGETLSVDLNSTQKKALQTFNGRMTVFVFDQLAKNDEFRELPSEDQVKELTSILTDINTAGKILILDHKPSNVNQQTQQFLQTGIDAAEDLLPDAFAPKKEGIERFLLDEGKVTEPEGESFAPLLNIGN